MKPNTFKILLLLFALSIFLTGCRSKKNSVVPEIAVSNSYLYSIAKDICGDTEVISLAPPGMCPGHFDISPRQVEQLSKCKTLLLFDFQNRIGDVFSRFSERGLQIHNVECPEGMCLPQTYITVARSVAAALENVYPDRQDEFEQKLSIIETRLENLDTEIYKKTEQLKNTPVITSVHQAEFVGALGLDVVATFSGSDAETPAGISQCLTQAKDKSVKLVIANRQEGTELAKALASHLNVKMVVFSNFPLEDINTETAIPFDSLLLQNVSQLTDALE